MEVFPYAWIVFISFVLIATFVMVNLVIAIVVEAMNKITKDEEENIIENIEQNQNITKKDIKKLEDKIEKITLLLENNIKK